MRLAEPSLASSGQCDLAYHSYALEVSPPQDMSDFVPLPEALRLCHKGQGDTHTEALCLRLADKVCSVPCLNMSLARKPASTCDFCGRNACGREERPV